MAKRGRRIELNNIHSSAVIRVLGFDCSSATIGWGLVTLDGYGNMSLAAHGHIKPPDPKHDLMDRLDAVFNDVTELCEILGPTHVAIEDIFIFMKGKSQARTITVLAAFNRVAALAAYRKVGSIAFLSVHEIRKVIRQACPSVTRRIEKEDLPVIIKDNLGQYAEATNRKGGLAKEALDESDGIAVAWAHLIGIRR
jgi:Holliday junction resolvasome RuvABC endonuclease subunit